MGAAGEAHLPTRFAPARRGAGKTSLQFDFNRPVSGPAMVSSSPSGQPSHCPACPHCCSSTGMPATRPTVRRPSRLSRRPATAWFSRSTAAMPAIWAHPLRQAFSRMREPTLSGCSTTWQDTSPILCGESIGSGVAVRMAMGATGARSRAGCALHVGRRSGRRDVPLAARSRPAASSLRQSLLSAFGSSTAAGGAWRSG